ncbi:hypothetical protein [Quadrisphaera setariae]|uniref:Uncharacterized protein n=1 Tax=Quadrisphaera setariae TaxID=2593304 RepID=A0A5C8ZHC1_9ACTN|nr:hypothetical protein [Quadrisphaera setariae]TXR56306.1 hypothetical protein FMM08_09305 [Quadrisphaera setariae]
MTRPAERDDLLLEHLLARDEPRAQAPRRDLAAMISMIVSLSGLAAAIFLGAVRSQLAEFYRPLGVSLEDVQLAAPYGGASFWSLGVFLGLLALFAAFASLGVVVRRSRPGRWAAVEVRRSRRASWLA